MGRNVRQALEMLSDKCTGTELEGKKEKLGN